MTDLEAELGITAPAADQLKSLETMIGEAVSFAEQVEAAELLVKHLKSEQKELLEKTIPDAMASAGVDSFKTKGGVSVSVRDFVNGSLPKGLAERKAAIEWLTDAGAVGLLKTKLELEFGRGDHNWAQEVKSKLDAVGASYKEKEDVHPQTLAAFARERMKNGEPVDLQALGLYAGRAAKIEVKK